MKGDRIGQDFYNNTDYFDHRTKHLKDLSSSFQKYRISKILEIYNPGKSERILDLGCGWGTFCWALSHRVQSIVGLDFSQKSIEICKQKFAGSGLKNISFLCANACNTNLEPESFDLIIAADLMEHLYYKDSKLVISEAFRLLKRGGHLSIWTPHRGHILEILRAHNIILKRDLSHVDYKSMESIKNTLIYEGFLIKKAYYVESHLPIIKYLEKITLAWIPLFRRRIAVLAQKP